MTPERYRQIQQILQLALELPDDKRASFLDNACGGDQELRSEVSSLLSYDQKVPESFLEQPGADAAVLRGDVTWTGAAPSTFGPGQSIGPYKLRHPLGKGGMGVVWMAEQREPVHRHVAIKIIKTELHGSQVIARFDAERQALALMDHPNIAKVLDAGTASGGRPYFVMELVKGLSFTRYCDQEKLTLKERIELFIPVCNAVQHAHQKGVVHRDLKPSNVLVALYDAKPVPKVIDSGVAKATHQKLAHPTKAYFVLCSAKIFSLKNS